MTQTPWKIDWNEELMLGIPEIDAEHKGFVALVNDLNLALAGRADKAEVREKLDLLLLDAKQHFQHEEELFAQYEYPDWKQHAELHRQVEQALENELALFDGSEFGAVWVESGLRIKQALVSHLLEEDMKYRDFMKLRMGTTVAST